MSPPDPLSPGELLRSAHLGPAGLDSVELARRCDLPLDAIEALLVGQREICADIDRRLGKALDTAPGYWMRVQQLARRHQQLKAMHDHLLLVAGADGTWPPNETGRP